MRFPASPPALDKLIPKREDMRAILAHLSPTTPDGRYLHWDELRRPPPADLTREHWWAAQKLARLAARVEVPGFVDTAGRPFWF